MLQAKSVSVSRLVLEWHGVPRPQRPVALPQQHKNAESTGQLLVGCHVVPRGDSHGAEASAELNLLYCLITNMVALKLLQDEREVLLYAVVLLPELADAL